MKKLNLLSILFVAILAIASITSCNPDEDQAKATISFIAEGGSIVADQTGLEKNHEIQFIIQLDESVDTKKKLKTFKVSSISNNTTVVDTLIEFNAESKKLTLTFHTPDTYSTPEVFTFLLTDKAGVTVKKVITVTTMAAPIIATPFGDIKYGGTFAHIMGPCHGAFHLAGDSTVGSAIPDAVKDIANTDAAGDPFTGSWESKNGVEFVVANSFDFDNGSLEEAIAAFDAGTASETVTNPAIGDVVIVSLAGSQYALIKITSNDAAAIPGCTVTTFNKGVLEFNFRMQ